MQPPNTRPNQELEFVDPVQCRPMALVAGYVGLASFLCFPAPLALGLGIVALRGLSRNPQQTGKGRAWFAIVYRKHSVRSSSSSAEWQGSSSTIDPRARAAPVPSWLGPGRGPTRPVWVGHARKDGEPAMHSRLAYHSASIDEAPELPSQAEDGRPRSTGRNGGRAGLSSDETCPSRQAFCYGRV